MHKIILLWENYPETVCVYNFEVDDAEFEKFKICNGKYIGLSNLTDDESTTLDWLNEYLVGKVPLVDSLNPVTTMPMVSGYLILSGVVL